MTKEAAQEQKSFRPKNKQKLIACAFFEKNMYSTQRPETTHGAHPSSPSCSPFATKPPGRSPDDLFHELEVVVLRACHAAQWATSGRALPGTQAEAALSRKRPSSPAIPIPNANSPRPIAAASYGSYMQRDSSANLCNDPRASSEGADRALDYACEPACDLAIDSALKRGCSPDACTMMFSMEMTSQ